MSHNNGFSRRCQSLSGIKIKLEKMTDKITYIDKRRF